MQADEEENGGHEIVSKGADVAHHPPGGGRDRADQPDGDEDAQGEQQGDLEGALRGDLPLLVDETDDERDAGEMAGAEQDAQDAPGEGRGERDGGTAFDGAGQDGEKLFKHRSGLLLREPVPSADADAHQPEHDGHFDEDADDGGQRGA